MNPREQHAGHACHYDHAHPGGQVDQTPIFKKNFNPLQSIKFKNDEIYSNQIKQNIAFLSFIKFTFKKNLIWSLC